MRFAVNIPHRVAKSCFTALALCFFASLAGAEDSPIAVLDFALNDLTPNFSPDPANREEAARTASIQPLLVKALQDKGGYRIVTISRDAQTKADAGFGYLWDHDDAAADLGRAHGADWIVVGRNHKPSYLFVYFQAHLIDTRTQRRVGDFYVEVKGQQQKITPKGVARLAEQIDTALQTRQNSASLSHAQ